MLGLFLDIEATGLSPCRHTAIDLAMICVDLTRNIVLDRYATLIAISEEEWARRDEKSIAYNGYTWQQLQQGISSERAGQEVIALLRDLGFQKGRGIFICQNPAFDRTLLASLVSIEQQVKANWPYHWLDLASMYWAMKMKSWQQTGLKVPDLFSLSKDDIAASFNIQKEPHPHRASNGVAHLISCYEALFSLQFDASLREVASYSPVMQKG